MQTEEQKQGMSGNKGTVILCCSLLMRVLQVLTTLKRLQYLGCEWVSVVNGRVDAEPMNAN